MRRVSEEHTTALDGAAPEVIEEESDRLEERSTWCVEPAAVKVVCETVGGFED